MLKTLLVQLRFGLFTLIFWHVIGSGISLGLVFIIR